MAKRQKDTFIVTDNTRVGALLTLMDVEAHEGPPNLTFTLTQDRHWEIRVRNAERPVLQGTVRSPAYEEQ